MLKFFWSRARSAAFKVRQQMSSERLEQTLKSSLFESWVLRSTGWWSEECRACPLPISASSPQKSSLDLCSLVDVAENEPLQISGEFATADSGCQFLFSSYDKHLSKSLVHNRCVRYGFHTDMLVHCRSSTKFLDTLSPRYVTVYSAGKAFRTPTIYSTLNPVTSMSWLNCLAFLALSGLNNRHAGRVGVTFNQNCKFTIPVFVWKPVCKFSRKSQF